MPATLVVLSGGLDSTFALWKCLSTTEKDIVVLHVNLSNSGRRQHVEQIAAKAVYKWCRRNVRHASHYFEASLDMTATAGSNVYDLFLLAPIVGATLLSHGDIDEVVTGFSTEERASARSADGTYNERVFQEILDIVWEEGCAACPKGVTRHNRGIKYDPLAYEVRAVDALRELPAELVTLTWSCRRPTGEIGHQIRCGDCAPCDKINDAKAELTGAKGTLIDHFHGVVRTIEAAGFPYWLDSGSLLGAFLTGVSFPWEFEVELGVLQVQGDVIGSLAETLQGSVSVNRDAAQIEVTGRPGDMPVRITVYKNQGDRLIRPTPNGNMTTVEHGSRECFARAEFTLPASTITFHGRDVASPREVAAYLKVIYGSDLEGPLSGLRDWWK